MDASSSSDAPTSAPGASRPALADPSVTLQLVAERVLLGALREQDAADAATLRRQRAEFLADASLRVGASLDQEITYAAIAGLSLPGLEGWCIVDVVETGGGLRRLAVIHPDETKWIVARELAGRWKPVVDDPIGVPAVVRDRLPVVIADTASQVVTGAARDPDTRRALESLGAGSLLVVPMIAHDVLFGAITFVSRAGAPPYTTEDVRLGESIAERCAQALESARLYAAARVAWAQADAALADANESRAIAEGANAAKAQFLRTMSHEFRTPLNAIGGYAQLLAMGVRGPLTTEQKLDIEAIERSQSHLLNLIETVLDFAQIEAGRVKYFLARVPLAQAISDVQALVAPQMRAKSVVYTFETCDPAMQVLADRGKFRQIVLNLLGNATKFIPQGGRIMITCADIVPVTGAAGEAGARKHAVHVTDTGVGIAADKLATVFEPFVQINRGLTSSDVGVGLGLSISRDLARGMGGDLTVTSTPGAGSTFTLTLPAAP